MASLWKGARAHNGLKPQGAPVDILRKHRPLEFGALLDPERLRAALRQRCGAAAGAGPAADNTD